MDQHSLQDRLVSPEDDDMEQDKSTAILIECKTCHIQFHGLEELLKHQLKTHTQPKAAAGSSKAHDDIGDMLEVTLTEYDENSANSESDDKSLTISESISNMNKEEISRPDSPQGDGEVSDGPGAIKCQQCNKNYENEIYLKRHMREIHDQDFRCEYCDKKSSTKSKLKTHQRVYCRALKCKICRKIFVNTKKLEEHTLTAHTDPNEFKCLACNKKFTTMNGLNIHSTHHHQKHQCSECFRSFPTIQALADHIKAGHIDEKPFKCEMCEKGFNSKYSLLDHQDAQHNGKSRHHCKECDMRFPTYGGLAYHKFVTHSTGKDFQCRVCQKTFFSDYLKQRHELVHEQRTVQTCDYCGYTFSHKSNLKKHILASHSQAITPVSIVVGSRAKQVQQSQQISQEPKPGFQCHICHKVVKAKNTLNEHIRTCHEITTMFKCEHCDKVYAHKKSLGKHFRAVHQQKEPTVNESSQETVSTS